MKESMYIFKLWPLAVQLILVTVEAGASVYSAVRLSILKDPVILVITF